MCGVFGWVKFWQSIDAKDIRNSTEAAKRISHRGPDAFQHWSDHRCIFCHARLAIIDLENKSNQPFVDSDSGLILTFNGEIYNYLELRESLKKHGITFKTQSDTEVLVKCFLVYGLDTLSKLDGMFAGSVYDPRDGSVTIFRDNYGQKPLYYYHDDGQILFSSELSPLLNMKGFDWKLSKISLSNYILNGYFQYEETPVSTIKKLLPGYFIKVVNGSFESNKWFKEYPGIERKTLSYSETVEQTLITLEEATKKCLRADVATGVFLSGGIDSSLIFHFAEKFKPDIDVFSVSFENSEYDESHKVREVAKNSKNIFIEEFKVKQVEENLDELLAIMDEPHGDPGYLNSYFISKFASKRVKVVLSGDGADELFCGYETFKAVKLEKYFNLLRAGQIQYIKKLTNNLFRSNFGYMGLQFKIRSFLNGFPDPAPLRYQHWLATLDKENFYQQLLMYKPVLEENFGLSFYFQNFEKINSTDKLRMYYQKTFLPEFVCHHTDRAAMLNGLEVRSPFLCNEVANLANRLPSKFLQKNGQLKAVLRSALHSLGASKEITKQKKQGFTMPLAQWQMSGLKGYLNILSNTEALTDGLFNQTKVDSLLQEHMHGRQNNYRFLHALAVYLHWRKKYAELQYE